MQTISSFLAKYNVSTHAIAVIVIALSAAFYGYMPFHNLVMSTYSALPAPIQVLIGTGLFIYALYKTGALKSKSELASPSSSLKLSAVALCSLLVAGSMPVIGCNQQQRIDVAQEIVNWTPTFISTADLVNSSIEGLDPAAAIVLVPLTAAINAFGPELQKAAQAYLANPNQTTLQVLQALVTQIQQDTNQALLAAAKITNPASQATATKDVNLISAIASAIFSLVQSISSKTQIAAMSTQLHVKFAQVRPYMNTAELQATADKTTADIGFRHVSTDEFFSAEARMGC
jgi:hypothetical protein